ncbi:hypothetical protein SAMN05216350_10165 [Polaromonas sp. YR568]|uniref:hypothetical protein n=1 Tax=Polaromonas sp. YR568 TaxID=1855301 RepID=UPI0008E587AA|nr:hypothetical protein [Polaromonas sp. YR568]SFU28224.1 hypothetical protein SAMN05216350_10165 [Polaromonas sp. YR568]
MSVLTGIRACCFFTALVALSNHALAQAEEPTFVGKLGAKELVLQFASAEELKTREPAPENQSPALADYFDRSVGRVIPLVKFKDGWLAECKAAFRGDDCTHPTGYWRMPDSLKEGSTKAFTAQWKAALPDTPVQIDFEASKLTPLGDMSVWGQLLGTGPTTLSRLPKRNGVVAGTLTDPRSGVKVPQVFSGYPTAIMKQFNAEQARRLVERTADRLYNLSMEGGEEDSFEIQYQSPRFLVWGGGQGGYYGGAHGLFAYGVETYDMKTGKLLKGKNALLKYYIDDVVIAETRKLRDESLKPSAATGVREVDECFDAWAEKILRSEDDEDAPAVKQKIRIEPSHTEERDDFGFMPQFDGLAVVSNDFAEPIRQCRGVVLTIPWKKARPYLKWPMF